MNENELSNPGDAPEENKTANNPDRVADQDDLHEIQAADDLGEPDPETTALDPTGAEAKPAEAPDREIHE
jgi:hypothetical protein